MTQGFALLPCGVSLRWCWRWQGGFSSSYVVLDAWFGSLPRWSLPRGSARSFGY